MIARRLGPIALAVALGHAMLPGTAAGSSAVPAHAKPVAGPRPTFKAYQDLLDQFLHLDAARDSGLVTSFNYEKLYDEPQRVLKMFICRQEFLRVSPDSMSLASRRAWAINFYNFLVIDIMTDHLLVPGKTRTRAKSIQDIRENGISLFKVPVVQVDTTSYTLDQFEKHFLFNDYERRIGTPPPATLDPRVHFAIVCAARGCPPLQPQAFLPESLDRQLDRAVRDALAGPNHLRVDPASGEVQISSIFYWYAADFGAAEAPLAWLVPYAPKSKLRALKAAIARKQTAPIQWDWALNQPDNWRFEEAMRNSRPFGKPVPKAPARRRL